VKYIVDLLVLLLPKAYDLDSLSQERSQNLSKTFRYTQLP